MQLVQNFLQMKAVAIGSRHCILICMFVGNAKSFAIVFLVVYLFLLVVVFGQTDKTCQCNFLLSLLWAYAINIGLINMICCVLSSHDFQRQIVMADLNKYMWNLALHALKRYLCYHNVYGDQTYHCGDLHEGFPLIKSRGKLKIS